MHIHILEHVVFFPFFFVYIVIYLSYVLYMHCINFVFYLIYVLHMHCINFVFYFQFLLNLQKQKMNLFLKKIVAFVLALAFAS
jgi:hypothetical protein